MIDWHKINEAEPADRLTALRVELIACGLDAVDADNMVTVIEEGMATNAALIKQLADLKQRNDVLQERNRNLKRRGKRSRGII